MTYLLQCHSLDVLLLLPLGISHKKQPFSSAASNIPSLPTYPLALASPLLRPTLASTRSTFAGGGDSGTPEACRGEPLDQGHGLASPGPGAEDRAGGAGTVNLYAHIPSRLHCPTTGSVQGTSYPKPYITP